VATKSGRKEEESDGNRGHYESRPSVARNKKQNTNNVLKNVFIENEPQKRELSSSLVFPLVLLEE
jgi:hypothetical protein